ncbi:MAG: hypothetical protein L0191_12155 [Acidobacteria bacterium]|nr:hypothetical protein [Acidobacteriota bacterium]
MKLHHVGLVVRSDSIANELCQERLKDDASVLHHIAFAVENIRHPTPLFSG